MTIKSGYKGVSWDKRRKQWRAVRNKPRWGHIGYFGSEGEAARAYDIDLRSLGVTDPLEFNFPQSVKK